MEQEKFQPTREQIIEAKFGKEALKRAEGLSEAMFETMKSAISHIGQEEGSPQQQKERLEEYFKMWIDFVNGLTARTLSVNATSPEIVETAIKGANALLFIEANQEGAESAKEIIEALKKRYGGQL